jgi:hypothetical protein
MAVAPLETEGRPTFNLQFLTFNPQPFIVSGTSMDRAAV